MRRTRWQPDGFPRERRDHLAGLEEGHFWFPPRGRLLGALLERCAGAGDGAVVELGCGTGGFLPQLAARHRLVVGVDAYADSLARAREREPRALLLEADLCRVPLAPARFEGAVALDVLEHLDEGALLGEAHRLVRPGGWLLVSVPAFPSLWSRLDEAAGHRRRYRRRTLERALAASAWELVHATHYQMFLFPLVWAARRLGRPSEVPLERRPPPRIGRLLGGVNALEVALGSGWSLPWGTSLCAVARRVD